MITLGVGLSLASAPRQACPALPFLASSTSQAEEEDPFILPALTAPTLLQTSARPTPDYKAMREGKQIQAGKRSQIGAALNIMDNDKVSENICCVNAATMAAVLLV